MQSKSMTGDMCGNLIYFTKDVGVHTRLALGTTNQRKVGKVGFSVTLQHFHQDTAGGSFINMGCRLRMFPMERLALRS
jgi:hypothetical protein